ETVLQRRHQPRDRRRRQSQSPGGRGKTAEVGHHHESLHGIQAIHGIISYLAIMNCQSGELFKIPERPILAVTRALDAPTWRLPMCDTHIYSSDVAFTPAVKRIQARKGSRDGYAQVEQNGGWRSEVDDNLAAFLADTNSLFLATASADGQPYIQHRGGP